MVYILELYETMKVTCYKNRLIQSCSSRLRSTSLIGVSLKDCKKPFSLKELFHQDMLYI